MVCASVSCNAESASSYCQSCLTHLEAGLEFLQVPDRHHHLVQALLDLGEGGMGGWIFEKEEAWKMFFKNFLKKWNFKTSIWKMDDGSKNFRAMSIRRLQIS